MWILILLRRAYMRSNTEIEGCISENFFLGFFYEGTWIIATFNKSEIKS